MEMYRKQSRPVIRKTAGFANNQERLSTCTECRYGIFRGQSYVWTKIGLVHGPCREKNSLDETKTVT